MKNANAYFELHSAESKFTFTLYPVSTKFNRLSGIYIFLIIAENSAFEREKGFDIDNQSKALKKDIQCPSSGIRHYSLLYAGIANNFYVRLKQHHKIDVALELGMNHIGILKITSGRKRKKIEREILKYLNPPLNQTWLHDYS